MKKYKQTIIPEVSTDRFAKMTKREMTTFVRDYYAYNYSGIIALNLHKNIIISFTNKGKRKTAFGEAMYPKKVAVMLVLDKLIQYGKFNNWGNRKPSDSKDLLGYYNFKSYVFIDGEKECVRLAAQVYKTGDICFNPYYNLEVNKKREKAGIPTSD
jgi:hypothetical protein